MHNRPRNTVIDEKQVEEKRRKIAKWNELKKQIFEERNKGLVTREQLAKLNNLLLLSPEFYAFWNYRKEIIVELEKSASNEDERKDIYKKELDLTEQILKERHTKSYGTWYHRKWCIVHVPEVWKNELVLTDKLLGYDHRNCNSPC
jgi:long-subunit acyl-CoA synthetase (AMP-forming)